MRIALPKPLPGYTARACDCDYCCAREAAYLSAGDASIEVRSDAGLRRDRQGSEQAQFLSCSACDSLMAVVCETDEGLIGAVNARWLRDRHLL
ncbi:MAG: aldehyde-activating protein, partial [Pseudomonadota bacterium]